MPLFFFHLEGASTHSDDVEGEDFPTLGAAEESAATAARQMVADGIRRVLDHCAFSFEIRDSGGALLSTVPFAASRDD